VLRIIRIMQEKVGESPVHVEVVHADALEEAQRLKERVASEFDCCDLWISEFSPIMNYTTDRGLIRLAFSVD